MYEGIQINKPKQTLLEYCYQNAPIIAIKGRKDWDNFIEMCKSFKIPFQIALENHNFNESNGVKYLEITVSHDYVYDHKIHQRHEVDELLKTGNLREYNIRDIVSANAQDTFLIDNGYGDSTKIQYMKMVGFSDKKIINNIFSKSKLESVKLLNKTELIENYKNTLKDD